MSAVRGRVREGRVELEGTLPEGSEVIVLPANDEQAFDLADTEVAELEARIAAVNRGEVVPAGEVLRNLRASR